MMKSESEAKPMMKSESEAKPMMKSESENHSYPVGSDPGLPYLPLVVTEVATDKEMIIRNCDDNKQSNFCKEMII